MATTWLWTSSVPCPGDESVPRHLVVHDPRRGGSIWEVLRTSGPVLGAPGPRTTCGTVKSSRVPRTDTGRGDPGGSLGCTPPVGYGRRVRVVSYAVVCRRRFLVGRTPTCLPAPLSALEGHTSGKTRSGARPRSEGGRFGGDRLESVPDVGPGGTGIYGHSLRTQSPAGKGTGVGPPGPVPVRPRRRPSLPPRNRVVTG